MDPHPQIETEKLVFTIELALYLNLQGSHTL